MYKRELPHGRKEVRVIQDRRVPSLKRGLKAFS
jgi:hypothetical protein